MRYIRLRRVLHAFFCLTPDLCRFNRAHKTIYGYGHR